ncbi:MAG: hypothetical protein J6M92_07430 [Oribacterium sp.]|nr:hypothetical protein [Oribacterium sp.]
MIDDAKVDSNGAWIQDGVVKTKNTPKSDNSILHQSINSNSSSNNNSITGRLQPGTYYCKSSYTINSYYDALGNIVPTGTVYLGASEDEYIILTGDTQKLNFEYYDWYTTRFSPDTDPLKMKGTFTRNSDGTYSVKNIDHTEKRNGKTWYPDEVDYSITSISDITSESFVIYNWSDGDGRSDTYTTMVRR